MTDKNAPTEVMETLVLGRYRLGPVIGRGGMSTVHRGEDTQLGRPVAIKVLAPHLSSDPQFQKRLLAEAQAAARLPHPHIVQVYDTGTAEDGSVVIVLELVRGESLQQRLARGRLPVEDAVEVAAQIAEALGFAHDRGVIHRDVKPHNVLLMASGTSATADPAGVAGVAGVAGAAPPAAQAGHPWAKLADFGIARSLDATSTLTATGLVLGSAAYIAPELLNGEPATARSDVYGLGVTLFQMLTGELPFNGTTAAASLTMRLAADAPRVRTVRPAVPEWLDGLLARMLARDPGQRFPDAASLARALRDPHGATTQVFAQTGRAPSAGNWGAAPAPEAPSATTGLWSRPPAAGVGGPANGAARWSGRRAALAAAALAGVLVLGTGVAAARPMASGAAPAHRSAAGPGADPSRPTATPAASPTPAATEVPTPTAIVVRLR